MPGMPGHYAHPAGTIVFLLMFVKHIYCGEMLFSVKELCSSIEVSGFTVERNCLNRYKLFFVYINELFMEDAFKALN